ncbi:MAG TPA: hypothetical protein VFU62_06040, partial [Hanamia sp.]|nr:hypothetical protein [Hanamia sp.]
EFFGDAAIYVLPENFKNIAEKMMLLFKDEKLRKDLIEKESLQIAKFLNQKNEDILFEIIKDVLKKNSSADGDKTEIT